jgi:hypothetical protein
MKSIRLMKQLSFAILALVLSAQAVSAQVIGANLAQFNILAKPQVVLTGFSPSQPLVVPVVGTSPGVLLTLTNASAGTYHANDATAVNGETEAQNLYNSLTAPAGANPTIAFGGTLPSGPLFPAPLPGINIYKTAASLSTTGGTATIITGGVNDIVIFQVTTSLTNTDHDIQVFGILPKNIYWQVTDAANVTNDDASDRGFPGTIVNQTNAQDVAIVSSGAGALKIGNLYSIGGKVSVTQSGAGVMSFNFAGNVGSPVVSGCTDGGFFPSPATGAVGNFSYCMESAGTVRIKVYNSIGDLASKIEETKATGTQTSKINTGRLAPGVYLYILERDYGNGRVSHSSVKKFAVKR